MLIPQETVERIQQSIEIADVIGDFVSLKKKGQYYVACCPFHNEKTPSFTVTPSKGIYKCFGCGKAGDGIRFIMEIESLTFQEALKFLAKKYGIEIKEEPLTNVEQELQNEKESLLIVLNFAKKYFHEILLNHEDGRSVGLSYFKERGFTEETIKKFELGYSLDEWDGFAKEAIKNTFSENLLEKAGLVISKENANDSKAVKLYDRFRGRVIFPIYNLTGRVIAFGARLLKNEKTQAKYLNSPESDVYHKSQVLYGLYQAKSAIRHHDNCYLVEGYTDVISLHQGGVENVVASSGTSLTVEQIRLVGRYSKNITVLYDGDVAGIKASLRGIDLILEEGLDVNVVLFPEGQDPDSYIRKIGPAGFTDFIRDSKKDFITFKTELSLKEAQNDPLKRAEVIREIVVSISKIPDAIKRAVFFRQCSILLEIEEQTLVSEFNKIYVKKFKENREGRDIPENFPESMEAPDIVAPADTEQLMLRVHERGIIWLLLNYSSSTFEETSNLSTYLLKEIDGIDFHIPVYKNMLELIRQEIDKGNAISPAFFNNHQDDGIRKEGIDLISTTYEISENWKKHQIFDSEKENLESNTIKSILRLKRVAVKCLIKENQQSLQAAQSQGEETEIDNLLKVGLELQKFSKQINKELGIVVG